MKRHEENDKFNKPMWLCKCDCGNEKIINGNSLKVGLTVSCGCYNVDKIKSIKTKHLKRNTKLYGVWNGMKQRCYNQNSDYYYNYGGRGITVCDEWLDKEKGFINFYNWAIENGYTEGLTIDRVDNDGNYKPLNCRWATRHEQNMNRRNTVFITINEETKPLCEWAEQYNIDYKVLQQRLSKGIEGEELLRPTKKEKGCDLNKAKILY